MNERTNKISGKLNSGSRMDQQSQEIPLLLLQNLVGSEWSVVGGLLWSDQGDGFTGCAQSVQLLQLCQKGLSQIWSFSDCHCLTWGRRKSMFFLVRLWSGYGKTKVFLDSNGHNLFITFEQIKPFGQSEA